MGPGRSYRDVGLGGFLGTRSLWVVREKRLGNRWKQALTLLQSFMCVWSPKKSTLSQSCSLHLP